MSIDLRGLRNFVAVASSGSISRAAESQHIAQPALSLQIKHIEEELGAVLFERHARGVRLTSAGQRFLDHATDILRRMDVACEDVRDAVHDPAGIVAVGMPQSVAKFLVVPLVSQVVRNWPKVQLQVLEMGSAYVPEEILRGRIHLGVTFGVEDDARIRFKHLLNEDLVLYTSPEQLLEVLGPGAAKHSEIELRMLEPFPMILPSASHSLRRRINDYLSRENVRLRLIAEVNTVPRLIDLVQAGVGSTVLSYASVDKSQLGKLAVLKVMNPAMHRSVYSCQLATSPLSLAATKVQELLHHTVQHLKQTGEWACSDSEGDAF